MLDVARLSEAKQKLFELQRRGKRHSTASGAVSNVPAGNAPMSLAQEQVWLRDAVAKAPLYNESITIYRHGPLDIATLERTLAEIIRRHEIWRTTFDQVDGRLVQIVHPAPASFRVPVVDLRSLPEPLREAEALRIAASDARPRFDLRTGPLLRITLVQLDDESYRLFLTAHQLVVDGVSVYSVFPTELAAIYEAFIDGRESPLPALRLQYGDFARWQREWLAGEAAQAQMNYWENQLAGELPVLRWPAERPPVETFRGAIEPFALSQALTDELRVLAQREGVTLFAVLLAGFSILLHLCTRQEDLVIGTLSPAGRKRAEFQKLLGYFLNPVALRLDLSGDITLRTLLRRSQKATLGAIAHDDVPLEHLAQRLVTMADPSRHPFFQTVISLAPSVAELPPGWSMTPMDTDSGGARWDLYLELSDRPQGILGRAQYNPDIYHQTAITDLLEQYRFILERVAQNPDLNLSAMLAAVQ